MIKKRNMIPGFHTACTGIALVFLMTMLYNSSTAQHIKLTKENLEAVHTSMTITKLQGRKVVKAIKDSTIKKVDEGTFVKLKGLTFQDGTIRVRVLSRLTKDAPDHARGFIGLAFRINEDNSQFENIYIRPANGRSSDQVRRNHSTQYFSYPDYKFDRTRIESPGKYESYADMELNQWIDLKIVVKGPEAKLFLDGAVQPALIVNDLKHGAKASGAIGLWVEIGTEGYFSDLIVDKE